MSDGDCGSSGVETEESLRLRHKQEKKELQSQIQKLKHSIPKNDKKRKKEAAEQISKMEADLQERQGRELQALKDKSTDELVDDVKELELVDENSASAISNETEESTGKRMTKAQKRRDKKTAKDKEREDRIKEQEVENLSGVRHKEYQAIKSSLKAKGLQISEIKSDGNCLYNAINHQLKDKSTCEILRNQAASFMRDNADDFIPFLSKENGDPYSVEDFESYCKDTANTTTWGGQLEVKALSHVLKQPIEIIQAEGPPVTLGDEYESENPSCIVLCYHRHAFGLGEHYNSVEVYKEDNDDFD